MTILELAEWHDGQAEECDKNAKSVAVQLGTRYPAHKMYVDNAARHRATAALLRELADKRAKFTLADKAWYDQDKWDKYASYLNTVLESASDRLLQEIKS